MHGSTEAWQQKLRTQPGTVASGVADMMCVCVATGVQRHGELRHRAVHHNFWHSHDSWSQCTQLPIGQAGEH